MTARPVLTRPVTVRKEAPVSRYRRWNELLELLATSGSLQVEDAAKALGVSAATVRRDFDELAGQQMLTRIRGGAVAQGVSYDLPLRYKSERHPSEKRRIAAVAGATTHHEGEASTGRLLARQASQVVVVADSSKVGRRTFARIFTAREADVLVTDAGIAAEDRARLEDEGVEVVLA